LGRAALKKRCVQLVAKLEKKNVNQQKMEEALKAARKKKFGKSKKDFRIGKES